jgi:hypothetical protein
VDGVVVENHVDCFVGGHFALHGIEKADDGHTSCTKRPTASEESTPFGQTISGREQALPYWPASCLKRCSLRIPRHQRHGPPGEDSITWPLIL